MRATVILFNGYNSSGILTYQRNVINNLKNLVDISTIQVSNEGIGRMNVGGIMMPFVISSFAKVNTEIVHSMHPYLINPKTNILTLIDILPLTCPDDFEGKVRRLIFKLALKRLPKMKKIITLTNYGADEVSEYFDINREKFSGIHCGVDHNIFYPSEIKPSEIDDNRINILFTGDIRMRKNLHLILNAVSLINKDEYRVIRTGKLRIEKWNRVCREIAEKNNIDYIDLGYISASKLRQLYTHADLFVFPSTDEGFGMPPMEAMACGTTPVVSNIPVFKEIYKDKVYYTEINAEDLADKIEHAVKHPKPKDELINYAKQFTWQKTAEKIYEVYEESIK